MSALDCSVVCGAMGQGAPQGRRGHIKECRKTLSFPLPKLGLGLHIFPPHTLPVFLYLGRFKGHVRGLAHVLCDRSDASGFLPPILDLISDSNHSCAGLTFIATCLKGWPMSFASSVWGFLGCFDTSGSPLTSPMCTALTYKGVSASTGTFKQWVKGTDG